MNKPLRNILFWTPRVLGILIAGLLTLLSTDVFAAGYPFWQSILGFLIHMLPAFAVILVIVLAWRWEWIGATGFLAFAIWYVAITWENRMHWSAYAVLAGVPALIGALFLVGWFGRKQIHR
jgi:hypothetical protein